MILPTASFLVLEKPKSCTCGGAQQVVKSRVNEPPSPYHMYVLNTSD